MKKVVKPAVKKVVKKAAAKKPIIKKAQNGAKAKPITASRLSKVADSLEDESRVKHRSAWETAKIVEQNPKMKESDKRVLSKSAFDTYSRSLREAAAANRYRGLVDKARKDSAAAANKKKNGGIVKKASVKKVAKKK